MGYHYSSIPPYRPYTPPPPPPPPPPPEILKEEMVSGAARCYFCGQQVDERAIRRTQYHVGHGHQIFVTICPACARKKENGVGPFGFQPSGQHVLTIMGVIVFAVFFLVFLLPGWLEMGRSHEEMKRGNEEFRRKFDEEWNRKPPGFRHPWP